MTRHDTTPLRNIRVLDCASFMAAPMAAMWLGDFGADVIKVEHPSGDRMRDWGTAKDGVPLLWKVVGRNKRSIGIDFHQSDGQALLRQLVVQADVLVENFRPGTMARWGLDYPRLSEVNSRLVMLSISAFGQTGPYSERAGFGTLAEAMSGYAYATGQPGGPPTLPSFALADAISGLCGAFAVMVALHERDRLSGRGQHIDLGIYEPMLTMLGHQFIEYDQLGIVAERLGSRVPFAAPRNVFLTADGAWVAISSSAQSVFERSCRAMGLDELVTDPRFADNRCRIAHADEIDEIFAFWIRGHDAATVLERFNAAGAAAFRVYNVADVFSDAHVVARGNLTTVDDVDLGPIRMQNVVPKLERTPGEIRHPGPRVGEHTDEILREWLDLDSGEIDELRQSGAVR